MNKIVKYGLLGTGVVVGVAAAGIAYVAATFDPNDYKDEIVKVVKDRTQRNLRLDGDIKLAFYPNIGVDIGKVSLSEFQNDREFAAIESARVSLALLPLLRRQFVVDEVALSGLQARLVMRKDGTTNIDDLLGQTERKGLQAKQKTSAASPIKFDIASISIKHAGFTYRDEGSGTQYTIKNVNLDTGRVAPGTPSEVVLATGVQANQSKLDVDVKLKTTLTFDPDRQKFLLQALELQVRGAVQDVSDLEVEASGEVGADLAKQEFEAKNFALVASGKKSNGKFEAKLDAPSLKLAGDKYSMSKLAVLAAMEDAFGSVAANLSIPGIEGSAQSFNARTLSLDVELKRPDQTFNVTINSPFSGSVKAQQFNLDDITVGVKATGDKLPGKSLSSEMKGSVHVDAAKQEVQANLAGGLLQSKIKARIGANGFAAPAIKFDVEADQIDADLFMPSKASGSQTPQAAQREDKLDLSALRSLDLNGSLRVGSLKLMNVTTTQLRADVRAVSGVLDINPMSASLYQGKMSGSLRVKAQGTPSIAIVQSLNGVNVAPLIKDAADLEVLEGRGNVGLNLAAQGNTVSAMKQALNGSASLSLANGAIKGINLTKLVQGMQSLSKDTQAQTLGVDKSEKTEFSEFKASFRVRNGVAHNDDLTVRSTVLRLSGSGDVDIGHSSVNYDAKATLAKTDQGRTATLPINVSGPFDAIKFRIDYGAMLADVVKQRVDEKKEKVKEDLKSKVQEELQKNLKGLFR